MERELDQVIRQKIIEGRRQPWRRVGKPRAGKMPAVPARDRIS